MTYKPDDYGGDVAACLRAAAQDGHDVVLERFYAGSHLVVLPNETANLTIRGAHAGCGVELLQLYGPGVGTRVDVTRAEQAGSLSLQVVDAAQWATTPSFLCELRQYVPSGLPGQLMGRWQIVRATWDAGNDLRLEHPLDFPVDPVNGATLLPLRMANGVRVEGVTFGTAQFGRLSKSTFHNVNGTVRWLWGYENRWSGISGRPGFSFQSAFEITDVTSAGTVLDFDGCSDGYIKSARSLMAAPIRNLKLAGCSKLVFDRAQVVGGSTGFCVTEACFDITAQIVDARNCLQGLWSNGRQNEGIRIAAFRGEANGIDVYATDALYLRRTRGAAQMIYPPGSDVV